MFYNIYYHTYFAQKNLTHYYLICTSEHKKISFLYTVQKT